MNTLIEVLMWAGIVMFALSGVLAVVIAWVMRNSGRFPP